MHPRQQGSSAEHLAKWLENTLVRPIKHKNEERHGVFKISHLKKVEPKESKQLSAPIKAGVDVGCWVEHPRLSYRSLHYCFAIGDDADVLANANLPELFSVKIRCLGQLRVVDEHMQQPWEDDEDRGVEYHAAYLLSDIMPPEADAPTV